jgi:hypothetical protein
MCESTQDPMPPSSILQIDPLSSHHPAPQQSPPLPLRSPPSAHAHDEHLDPPHGNLRFGGTTRVPQHRRRRGDRSSTTALAPVPPSHRRADAGRQPRGEPLAFPAPHTSHSSGPAPTTGRAAATLAACVVLVYIDDEDMQATPAACTDVLRRFLFWRRV